MVKRHVHWGVCEWCGRKVAGGAVMDLFGGGMGLQVLLRNHKRASGVRCEGSRSLSGPVSRPVEGERHGPV